MGTQSLITRSNNQTIDQTWWNLFNQVLEGDFVPRNTSGVPQSAAGNLGTATYPWNGIYAQSLILGGSTFSSSLLESPPYAINSGRTRSTSNQPSFILPAGSALSFTVKGATTPLVYNCNGTIGTISSDISTAGTAAPSTQNTATINDATATGQAATRVWGELFQTVINIGSVGTNIQGRAGSYQAFKIGSEYFIAYIESGYTQLTRAMRGYFFDSSENPVKRSVYSNGATVTLMNLGWIFADAAGTIDVIFTGAGVNNTPTSSFSAPSSTASGDYWYDQGNQVWKRYSASAWSVVSRIPIGLVVCDSSNCVAARSFNFYGLTRSDNTINLENFSTTVMKGSGADERINVKGSRIQFYASRPVWDTASNLAASTDRYNATVTASVNEYFYVTDQGDTKISDIEPYYRPDLLGYYHPYNPWRCVGYNVVDGSAHFTSSTTNYGTLAPKSIAATHIQDGTITGTQIQTSPAINGSPSISGNLVCLNADTSGRAFLNMGGYSGAYSVYWTYNNSGQLVFATCNLEEPVPLKMVRGTVTSTGVIATGYGYSVVANSTGNYTVTYSNAFPVTPTTKQPTVVVSLTGNSVPGYIVINGSTSSGFTALTFNTSGVATSYSFCFIAMGSLG